MLTIKTLLAAIFLLGLATAGGVIIWVVLKMIEDMEDKR
jgi:hypothetical protein